MKRAYSSFFCKSFILVTIPLSLSAFTHLLNPIGFPSMHPDEGTYMDRTMRILEGEGPQQPGRYDHPYFGQLFMAAALGVIGYPDSLHSSATYKDSIEPFILIPRFLMGILSVIDTFLIYQIAKLRYSKKVGLFAAIIFAITPIGLILIRVLLDNILLPFLLSSILFASYYITITKNNNSSYINSKKNIPIVGISGIFLGLAIFTKITVFTMIPLVGFLIYKGNRNDLKMLAIWFIPVIVIPAIWPAYMILNGHFDDWLNGVLWQATERGKKSLSYSVNTLFELDPLFLLLSMAGVLYAGLVVKRDFFILLWAIPFLVFAYFIGFVLPFHFALLLPLLSIAAAILIVDLTSRIARHKSAVYQDLLPFAIISVIGIFQLVTIAIFISMNVNDAYFEVVAFVTEHIPDNSNNDPKNQITVIGRPDYLWIPKYAFGKDQHDYTYINSKKRIETEGFLLIVDKGFKNTLSTDDKRAERNQMLYHNSTIIKTIGDNKQDLGQIEIRTNY